MSDDWFETAAKEMAEEVDDQEIPWWDPEPGTILKSVFERASAAYSDKFDKPFFILIVKDIDSGEHVKLGTMRFLLHKQVVEAMPAIGSLFAVEYGGKKKTKDESREYHYYKVRTRESDPKLWHQLGLDLYAKGKEGTPTPVDFGPTTDPF